MSIICSTKENSIVFEKVSFAYGNNSVLEDISFSLPSGDFVAIVGPNGAGKSTLLKILLGLLSPKHGSVHIFGHNRDEAKQHLDIGYVPQRIVSSDINIPATVEEVVRSGQANGKGQIAEALEQVNITHLKNRQIRDLSGGEKQRVFIARALARNPKILILDEPTVGVDMVVKEKFFELLQTLNERGLTIVIVSHDVDIMAEKTKHILGLNRKLVCDISADKFDSHKFVHDLYGEKFDHHSHV